MTGPRRLAIPRRVAVEAEEPAPVGLLASAIDVETSEYRELRRLFSGVLGDRGSLATPPVGPVIHLRVLPAQFLTQL